MPLILEGKQPERKWRRGPPVLLACGMLLPLVASSALLAAASVEPVTVTFGRQRWTLITWTESQAVSRASGLPYGYTYLEAPNDGTDAWMLQADSWLVLRVERTDFHP